MNIVSALMKENICLVSCDRWLTYDATTEEWVVREKRYYA